MGSSLRCRSGSGNTGAPAGNSRASHHINRSVPRRRRAGTRTTTLAPIPITGVNGRNAIARIAERARVGGRCHAGRAPAVQSARAAYHSPGTRRCVAFWQAAALVAGTRASSASSTAIRGNSPTSGITAQVARDSWRVPHPPLGRHRPAAASAPNAPVPARPDNFLRGQQSAATNQPAAESGYMGITLRRLNGRASWQGWQGSRTS